ncbi:hypothetical protein Poli38472_011893 [Pythium oligandrum]|uniref:Peptidase M14 domain-containing protein n=1 Tax=Pythium oligandrum TaxID=41045 RepID=A0A8K1FCG8_PYTOL|nr:hypothetical protein Poli38472_011893 [Pythium oligandrum]|eukprot:TMW58305.1 hypothetical protein Poli38472_011893 [Pythium oligandrum]
MTALSFSKFRAGRFRQSSDSDVLLPPPLPLISLPDEARLARSGAFNGRPMHLPVRRHVHSEQRNAPPEPILRENRMLLDVEAEEDEARPILQRIHVYEYNQPEVFAFCGAPDDTLDFDALFESGNLQRAERIIRQEFKRTPKSQEYELRIHPDLKNSAYRQWFYFSVRNGQPGASYKFSLVNHAKSGALFGAGLQPVVYSEIDAETKQRGWIHAGTHVRYDISTSPNSPPGTNALSFQYTFEHANDRVYFACLQPYTYTDMCEYLDKLERDPARSVFIRRTELCQTIALNPCDLLSITSPGKDSVPPDDKKIIVLSARVHPGEPNASWMMQGMLDYLTGPSSGATVLRNHFIFKVVPMLNPDGVINGNTRVNLAGWDLNRKWASPVEKLFPTIYHLKRQLAHFQSRDRVAIFCDLHGHSINRNIFMYGCYNKKQNKKSTQTAAANAASAAIAAGEEARASPSKSASAASLTAASIKNDPRVFPMIVARNSLFLSFASCDFKVHKSKLNTARVVVNHELGVINSYTLEASFCGPDFGPRKDTQFSTWDLEEMGRTWCQSLLIYFGLLAEVRVLDRRREEELQRTEESIKAVAIASKASGENETTLLEQTSDLLSDCEAAISELVASGELLDTEYDDDDGGGGGSGDSDLSGAEDAIPPSNGTEEDTSGLVNGDSEARAVFVNGYSSAPEAYSRNFESNANGSSGGVKKLKRRSSRRKSSRSNVANISGKSSKKKKKRRKSKGQRGLSVESGEEGGGERQEDAEPDNDVEDTEERETVSRKKSKKTKAHRSQSPNGRSKPRKSSSRIGSSSSMIELTSAVASGRLADIVLPEVRQETPPSQRNKLRGSEDSVADDGGAGDAGKMRLQSRGKLVRIRSGQLLELPLVKPFNALSIKTTTPAAEPPEDDDASEHSDDEEDEEEDDRGHDDRHRTSSSSSASDPESYLSEF